MVYNVLDQQETTQTYARQGVNYLRPFTAQTPRYVRFGVNYDF
jgi:outer membrane receptor protein involved in Fe transport